MKTIKIIDLLNKIANGDIPTKIKYKDIVYKYDNYKGDCGYVDMTQNPYKWFEKEIDCDVQDYLNEEIEILEDEKKLPKKMPYKCSMVDANSKEQFFVDNINTLRDKINGILDYLESKGK